MDIRTVHDHRRFASDKMQKVGIFATDHVFCDLYCFEPGQAQKPHEHPDSDKVYVVLEGRGQFQIGTEVAEVGPGQAVLAPAGQMHGVENQTSDRLTVLVLVAPPPPNA